MLTEIGKRVKNAAAGLAVASTDDKNKILKNRKERDEFFSEC